MDIHFDVTVCHLSLSLLMSFVSAFLTFPIPYTVQGVYSSPPYCKDGHPEPWGKGGSEDGGVVLWLDELWAGVSFS